MTVIDLFVSQYEHFYYFSIPLVCGLVGLITNYIGIKMMFYPYEFVGVRPFFGWQGIIPARAEKFARLQIQQVEKIINVREILNRVDAQDLLDIMEPESKKNIEQIVDKVASESFPILWENAPLFIKRRILNNIEKDFPQRFRAFYSEIDNNIGSLFCAKTLVIDKLTNEKDLLVDLIKKTINKELTFIVKSGLYLGTVFGVFQMVLCLEFSDQTWILPTGGFIVGYLTNYIAVKLMFRPLNPINFGPFVLHGLFLKRKDEVAEDYSNVFSSKILDSLSILNYLLKNNGANRIRTIIEKHIKASLDKSLGVYKPLITLSIGTQRYIDLPNSFSNNVPSVLDTKQQTVNKCIDLVDRKVGLREDIENSMKNFSNQELDDFVRPIFEEDEWILYAVGGALGFLAGCVQVIYMFS